MRHPKGMRRIVLLLAIVGCSDVESTPATSEVPGSGGALAETGGAQATGGSTATGGATVQTGGVSTGGTVAATGGAQVATGGVLGTGGIAATGGALSATGGASMGGRATGGASTGGAATGGTPATGGAHNRCPVGIDRTVVEYVDANGQCYSRVGVVSVPLVTTGRATLTGYQNSSPDSLSEAVNEAVSSDCDTKIVVIGSGKVFWCGTRLRTDPWRCPAGWEALPRLTEEFWILSYAKGSVSGSCASPCNSDMLGRLITDTTS